MPSFNDNNSVFSHPQHLNVEKCFNKDNISKSCFKEQVGIYFEPKNQQLPSTNLSHKSTRSNLSKKQIVSPTTPSTQVNKEFLKTFPVMEGLLVQYEAILTYERKQQKKQKLLQQREQQQIQPQIPSGFLENDKRFWEFRIENDITTFVRYGYIEPDGSLKERAMQKQEHATPVNARRFVERIIDEKLNSGYVGWTHW
ncbi:hypothetical protein G9A89_023120 [Geosiphon pyriformis]|nr:hypothetical protein G9A89_023120 [Geosiphon pyriformis]